VYAYFGTVLQSRPLPEPLKGESVDMASTSSMDGTRLRTPRASFNIHETTSFACRFRGGNAMASRTCFLRDRPPGICSVCERVVVLLSCCCLMACGADKPAIPHAVASTENSACAKCHKTHHDGDQCVSCHQVQKSWLPTNVGHPSKEGTSAPWVSHQTPELDDASCLDCHSSGKWDAPAARHATQPNCVNCHGSNQ
jgi:hypothetical protein